MYECISTYACIYVCINVCMKAYIYMYVCMYIYVCICVCMYVPVCVCGGRKEGIFFIMTHSTQFYLRRLYDIGLMVKDYLYQERGLYFPISFRGKYLRCPFMMIHQICPILVLQNRSWMSY